MAMCMLPERQILFFTVAGSIPYMIAVVLVVALAAMLLARRITIDKMILPLNQVDLENFEK